MATLPPQDEQPGLSKAQKGAAAIALAVPIAAALAMQFEGWLPKAKPDPAGIPTYCYGETQLIHYDPSRIYDQNECAALLRKRLATSYAPLILKCVPSLTGHQYPFGALLDASYNAGAGAACKSPMAQEFRSGQWQAGCNHFPGWRVTAVNRKTGQRIYLKGLARRRIAERLVCLK